MRRGVILLGAAVLFAGPTVLAFFAGGYFDVPRLIAAIVAWALVLAAALTSPQPLPRSWPGRAAVAGLFAIWAWTALSLTWAPQAAPAFDYLVRVMLYVAALVAAAALLRGRAQLRAVEPLFALGAVIVIGYGLAGRLLPGIVHQRSSHFVGGRLEQPLTYWNAEGALAAMGLVLCARLAGDRSRPRAMRVLGAVSCVPLGMGLYLTYSRGAVAAGLVGLVVLVAAAPSRSQLRAIAAAVTLSVVAAVAASAFSGVASREGTLADRETEGLIMLAILLLLMAAAGAVAMWLADAEPRGRVRMGRLPFARRLPTLAVALVVLTLAGLVIGGLGEKGNAADRSKSGQAARLTSLESTRYDYWRIGLQAFGDHPLKGTGAAGFRVVWLRERPVEARALEVHSLALEMASDLGIVGLLALGLFLGGAGVAARRGVYGEEPALAGAMAAVTVWVLHSMIDWDWQMPAVTLPALVMIGALIASSEGLPEDSPARSAEGGVARRSRGVSASPAGRPA